MEKNKPDLGPFLRSARERTNLSLRAVEDATGVSNPYLSQLESGKVRQPSPVVLHKLAKLYEVSYSDAMRLAGYPVPGDSSDEPQPPSAALRFQHVTEEEADALEVYLEFLRSKRPRRRR